MAKQKILTIVESPGKGKYRTEVDFGVTIAQIVAGFNLFGRQIVADGEPVDVEAYETTLVDDIIDLWAIGATKGAQSI